MTTLFIRHRVVDYPAWRKVYDAVADMQRRGGVTAAAVYWGDDDPNDITVTHDFADAATAHAFVQNPEPKAAMDDAGVVGAPTFGYANRR